MDKKDYPTVILFKRKEGAEGGRMSDMEAVRFDNSDYSSETLRVFLRQNTGHRLAVKGCMEKFDRLADK